jgi:xanthine/CO dehydrogenase XdhC/CoxF family maturation factor
LTTIGSRATARRQLFAPIGLDLGAEGPEQIALSILAEIQSALCGRAGGPLRDRAGSIHSRRDPATAALTNVTAAVARPTVSSPISCPQ